MIRIGNAIDIAPADAEFTLDELQGLVGGTIQIIPLEQIGMMMVMDDEGKLKGLPRNDSATALARSCNALLPGDYVAGVAVVIREDQIS